MLKTSRPLLLGLLLFTLICGAWVVSSWLESSEGERTILDGVAAERPPALPGPRASESEKPVLETDAPSAEEQPKRVEVATVAEEPGALPAAELAEAIWVEGRVLIPDGTPVEERIEVVARGRKFADGRFHSSLVSPQGHFRVAFSKRTKTAYFKLQAQHLFLEQAVQHKLDDLPDDLVLEARLGGRILGRLVQPSNAAEALDEVPDLEVNLTGYRQTSLNSWSGGPLRAVPVGANLEFEIGGVAPDLKCEVSCDPGPFVPAVVEDIRVEAGQDHRIELSFVLGARVSGRVTRPDGQPIEKVRLSAQNPRQYTNRFLRQTRTNEDGEFDLRGIFPGETTITAVMKGVSPTTWGPEDLSDGDELTGVEIILGDGGAITGLVSWPSGEPAKKARVKITRQPSPEERPRFGGFDSEAIQARADKEGRFEVLGLDAGQYVVRASATRVETRPDSKKQRSTWRAKLKGIAPGQDVLLSLDRGLSLSGRVVDDAGAAVESCSIAAVPTSDESPYGDWSRQVSHQVRAADGTFTLTGLEDGRWEIRAVRDSAGSKTLTVEIPGEAGPITLEIPRPAVVLGFVVDSAGRPVEGAHVFSQQADGGFRHQSFASEAGMATTDAQGRFMLEAVSPGAQYVVAKAIGFAQGRSQAMTLAAAQRYPDVRVELSRGGTISGEVLGPGGAPASEYQVSFYGGELERYEQLATDKSGRFRFEHLEPGTYQVTARPPSDELGGRDLQQVVGELDLDKSVVVTEGESVHIVLGAPSLESVRVFGRVLAGGEALANMGLIFRPTRGNALSSFFKANTGERGRYEVQVDHPGEYDVRVWTRSGGGLSFTETIPAQSEHELDIEFSVGGLRGTVYGPDGEPAAGVRVRASREGGSSNSPFEGMADARAQTDAAGRYEIDTIPSGRWTLRAGGVERGFLHSKAQGAKYGQAQGIPVEVEAGEVVDGVDFHLALAGSVSGRVLDVDGRAVEEASVYLIGEDGGLLSSSPAAHTAWNGTYRVDGLSPGTVRLFATSNFSASPDARRVTVRSGDNAKLDLDLGVATVVRVQAVDAHDMPVQASLQVTDEGGREHPPFVGGPFAGWPTRRGRGVGPLPPGKYWIRAQRGNGATTEASLSVVGQPEQTLELRFEL